MIFILASLTVAVAIIRNQCLRQNCIITSKETITKEFYIRQSPIIYSYYFWFRFIQYNNSTYDFLLQSTYSPQSSQYINITVEVQNQLIKFKSHDPLLDSRQIHENVIHMLNSEWYVFLFHFEDQEIYKHYRTQIMQSNKIVFDVECIIQNSFLGEYYLIPHYNPDVSIHACARILSKQKIEAEQLFSQCADRNVQLQFIIPYLFQNYQYDYLFQNNNFSVQFWLRNRIEGEEFTSKFFEINSYTYRKFQKDSQQQLFELSRLDNSYNAIIYGLNNIILTEFDFDFRSANLYQWHYFIYSYDDNKQNPGQIRIRTLEREYSESFGKQQLLTDNYLQFYNSHIVTNTISLNFGDQEENIICQPNCLTCDSIDNFQCLWCKGNRILKQGQCHCPEFYLIDFVDDDCKYLPETIEVNIRSIICPLGQEVCEEGNIKCEMGYYLQQSSQECIKCKKIGDHINMDCYFNPTQDFSINPGIQNYIIYGQKMEIRNVFQHMRQSTLIFNSIRNIMTNTDNEGQLYLTKKPILQIGCQPGQVWLEDGCIYCPQYCFTCIVIDDQFRCTSCIDYPKYYLTLSGYCQPCLMENCEVCYQYAKDDFEFISLSELSYSDKSAITACAKCINNTSYNYDTQQCELITLQGCELTYTINNQSRCIQSAGTQYISSVCSTAKCSLCHLDLCIKCNEGYMLNEYYECDECSDLNLINCHAFSLEFQNHDYANQYSVKLIHGIEQFEKYSFDAIQFDNCIEYNTYVGFEYCFDYNGQYKIIEGSQIINDIQLLYMCQKKNYLNQLSGQCFEIIKNDTKFAINHLGSPILCNTYRICSNFLKYKATTNGKFIHIKNSVYDSINSYVNQLRQLQYFTQSINEIIFDVDIITEDFYHEFLSWGTILQYNGLIDINITLTQKPGTLYITDNSIALQTITMNIGTYNHLYLYNFTSQQQLNIICKKTVRFDNIELIYMIAINVPNLIITNITLNDHQAGLAGIQFYGQFHHQLIKMSNFQIHNSDFENLIVLRIQSTRLSLVVTIDNLEIINSTFSENSVLISLQNDRTNSTLELSDTIFRNVMLDKSFNFFGYFQIIRIKNFSMIDCIFRDSEFLQQSRDVLIYQLQIHNLISNNTKIIVTDQQNKLFINTGQIEDSQLFNSSLIYSMCKITSIETVTITNVTFINSQFIQVQGGNTTLLNYLVINNSIGIVNLFNIESNFITIANIKISSDKINITQCQFKQAFVSPFIQIYNSDAISINNLEINHLCLYSSFFAVSNTNHQRSQINITTIDMQNLVILTADNLISCNAQNSSLLLSDIRIYKIKLESSNHLTQFYMIYIIAASAKLEVIELIKNVFDLGRQNSYFYFNTKSISINGSQIINDEYCQEIIAEIETQEFQLTNTTIVFKKNRFSIESIASEYLIVLVVRKSKNINLQITSSLIDFDYLIDIHQGLINIQQQIGTILISNNQFKGLKFRSHCFIFGAFMGHISVTENIFTNHNSGLFKIDFTDQMSSLFIEKIYVSRQNKCGTGEYRNLIHVRNGQIHLSEINILNMCFTGILLEYNQILNIQTIIVKQSFEMNNILSINAISSNTIQINNLSLKDNTQLKYGLVQIRNLVNHMNYKIDKVTLINNICNDYCILIKASQQSEVNQRLLQSSDFLQMNSIVLLQNIGKTLVSIHYIQLKMIDAFLYSSEQQLNQATLTFLSRSEGLSFYDSKIYINENGLQLNFSKLSLTNTMIYNIKTKFYFGKYRQIMVSLDNGSSMLMNQRVANVTDQTQYDYAKVLKQNIIYDQFYIPSGQSFNQYQRLNFQSLQYEDYKIHFKFNIANQFGFINDDFVCQLNIYDINRQLMQEINLNNYNLTQFQVIYPPMSKLEFRVYCDQEDEDPLLVIFNTKIFTCQVGEILNNNQCLRCQSQLNLYSVQLKALYCQYQDFEKITDIKSGLINLRKSYWRPSLTNSIIEECNKIQNSCSGGWNAGDKSCEIGHLGALCSECDLYNIYGNGKYQKGQNTKCRQCDFSYSIIWQILLILIIQLLMIFMDVSDFIKQYVAFKTTRITQKNHRILIQLSIDQSSILLKLFGFYIQLTMLSNNIPIVNFLSLKSITDLFVNSSLSMSSRLQCLLSEVFSQTELQYMNSLFTIIFSVMALNFYILLLAIMISRKMISYTSIWISTALFYLLMMNYANYFDYLIQLVTWKEISGIRWVTYNLSLKYDSNGNYLSMLTIVLPQLFNVLFLPVLLLIVLRKKIVTLDNQNTYKSLGYFYKDFSRNRYYWGIVQKILRSCSIIVVYVFQRQELTKILVQVSYLLIYQRFQQFQQPYSIHRLNNLDSQLIYFQCLSIAILGLIKSISEQKNAQLSILVFIFYLVNLLALVRLSSQILILKRKEFNQHLAKISKIISKISPKLETSFKLSQYIQQNNKVQQNIGLMRKYIIVKQSRSLSNNGLVQTQLLEGKYQSDVIKTQDINQHNVCNLDNQNHNEINQKQIVSSQINLAQYQIR